MKTKSFCRNLLLHAALMASAAIMSSCEDNVKDDAYYTFTGDTVASYCCGNPDLFSTFYSLIEDTGTYSLLSTYGHYTCFAPDNEAFEAYFQRIGKGYAELTNEEKTEIVYNHVIKSGSIDFTSDRFEEGALSESTMGDNYIVISYSSDNSGAGLTIYVNKDVPIIERDIEVHNGVIHHVGAVITPTSDFIGDVILDTKATGGKTYRLFSEALEATHLSDAIKLTFDDSYISPCTDGTGMVQTEGWTVRVPMVKKYGFTLFAEPDDVMAKEGINTFEDLVAYAKKYYGNGSDDYADPDNALHKFVAYHLLDRQMSTNSMLYSGLATAPNSARDRVEFYETMYEYHLLKINVGIALNRSERNRNDYIALNETHSNISAVNGYIHCLESMLVYDSDRMENDVLNCRIRFDMFNVPPELTNNNIRWQLENISLPAVGYTIPHDFCSKHLSFTEETKIMMWASIYWDVHQADEIKLNGWYDFTLRMLPVPPGSYEVRVGYRPESWRGIAQFFIDGEIQGIPRDLRIDGSDPQVGWIADTGGPQDAENDKAMRNRGYMKAPASMWSNHDNCSLRDISSKSPLRMIIGTVNFQEYGAHYLRAKNVYADDREYNGDYIELIPTSLIDTEDIY